MEKEWSHYLQNFAIQSQLSKRCASYPTLHTLSCSWILDHWDKQPWPPSGFRLIPISPDKHYHPIWRFLNRLPLHVARCTCRLPEDNGRRPSVGKPLSSVIRDPSASWWRGRFIHTPFCTSNQHLFIWFRHVAIDFVTLALASNRGRHCEHWTTARLCGIMHQSSIWIISSTKGILFRQCWKPYRNRMPLGFVAYITWSQTLYVVGCGLAIVCRL